MLLLPAKRDTVGEKKSEKSDLLDGRDGIHRECVGRTQSIGKKFQYKFIRSCFFGTTRYGDGGPSPIQGLNAGW